MNIILLDRISSLGNLGEQVRVKAGYARNYLIPQGKALPATKPNIERFEAKRAELEKAANARIESDKNRAMVLDGVVVSIKAQAGDEGRLFGSVSAHEIANALKEAGHTVAKSEIKLPEGPIRQVGEYEIELQLHGHEVVAQIKLSIVAA